MLRKDITVAPLSQGDYGLVTSSGTFNVCTELDPTIKSNIPGSPLDRVRIEE
jgi:hypothetical protein